MSMNKYMHPRNIYKTPPNFKKLAMQYPEFRQFVHQDLTGTITLDFRDLKSLRALSCILLKEDFGLDVEIPLNKLIPTIPLRLNYILWIEDLLALIGKTSNDIIGLDIGTGASCIYPLLAAKKNMWRMIATEMESDSFDCAKMNVEKNNLTDLIKLIQVNKDQFIESVISNEKLDFCMCNPPFFASTQELHPFFKSRTANRPHPKNAFCAATNEVVSKGGEVEFISHIIEESQRLRDQITIYTTMVGHKSSLPPLKSKLRELKVSSFKETEFCQGNTTRWGLAWTYCNIDLRKAVDAAKPKKLKPKPALQHLISFSEEANEQSINLVADKLLAILNELQMAVEDVTRNKLVRRFVVTAFSNTWSHQRRKRREQQRHNNSDEFNTEMEVDNNNMLSPKRKADDGCDSNLLKKLKIDNEIMECEQPFLKFSITVRNEANNVYLEMDLHSEEEFGNKRELLHQILQFIKNHLNI